jgi:octaprenyl-diphosphate synthase
MIEGELYQLTKTGQVDLSEAEHFEIISRKTAFLFGGCSKIGGMLGDTTPAQQQALWDYGFNLGVAFQIVDDLLDYTADELVLGKPIGSDLREGKVTLPVIRLLQRVPDRADALVRKVVGDRQVSAEDWAEIKHLLAESRASESAFETAVEHARKAQRCLDAFPDSVEREALVALPEYVLSRDR